jgi:5-methylcytosine-specific restriction endonuclease McrA
MKRNHRGEYPPDWAEIAAQTKEGAGWECVRCGHAHEPATGYSLTVHHLDLDKSNCRWWNLAALCQRCHLQIQGRVIMERPWMLPHSDWFKPYVAGYYAFHHSLPDDRESVVERVDWLIALGQGLVTI